MKKRKSVGLRDMKHTETHGAPTRWMRLRVVLLGAAFAACLLGLFGRAVHLQVNQRDWLKDMAEGQYVREVEIPARRGDVFDRRGVALAKSVDVDSVWVDPSMLADRKAAAKGLARALGLDANDLDERLVRGKRFAWVKRAVSPQEVERVKKLGLPGLRFAKEPRRFYPQRELGAHVMGLVGTDGHGLDGLEYAFDDELSGAMVKRAGFRDAKGRKLVTQGIGELAERQGAAVTLTLDRHLQYVTEKALNKAVADARAVAGMAVVLDPRTGELLAIANAPRFNPNTPAHAQKKALRNRAVADAFEPGSTFKAFVIASALDEGVITEQSTLDCERGRWTVGRHVIHDDHPSGVLTPQKILQVSSNICAAKVGQKLGRDRLGDTFARFGFGERPELGLPGESKGVVPVARSDISLATQSFGQGLTTSAIQLAAAYGALANGGVLMKPYLIAKVVDSDGLTLIENTPVAVRRAVSEKSARSVVAMLETVVEKGGTAPRARMDEYRVAGKTGTAQKADPVARGYSDKRIGSFVGMVPAENPRVVIVVILDEPETDVYGGIVAAPAFKEIATQAMPHLAVPPSRPGAPKPAIAAVEPPPAPFKSAVVAAIEQLDSLPTDGDVAEDAVRVPDVSGLPARAATARMLTAALEPRLIGSGTVVGQQPAAGSLVDRGTRVSLRLAGHLRTTPQ